MPVGCKDYTCTTGAAVDGATTSSNAERCVPAKFICTNGTPADGYASVKNTTKCKACNSGFILSESQTCVNHAFICTNGTPADGGATEENITRCTRCNNGYTLTAAKTCVKYAYVCENGTPSGDDATADNITKCQRCNSTYTLSNNRCDTRTQYICTNGVTDSTITSHPNGNRDQEHCESCTSGYALSSSKTCLLRTATAIALGETHTCALLDNGTVKCWGSGLYGKLGYGDTNNQTSPPLSAVNLGPGRTATTIVTKYEHSCALLDNGAIKCWGLGNSGQLGYGNTNNQTSPPSTSVNLGTGRTATTIVTGGAHTCAILDNSALKCWGWGGKGQLGYGNTNNQTSPPSAPINLGTGRTATAIATGVEHTCALLDNGTVKCWGEGHSGRLGYDSTADHSTPLTEFVNLGANRTATAIATGGEHTCAILDNGAVKCWGYGGRGQLGYGNTTNQWSPPTSPNNGYVNLGPGRTATAIATGGEHTCAILDNNMVKCWGDGRNGALGYGNLNSQTSPPSNAVNLGPGPTATAIAAGTSHTCALLDNGAVKCWGLGSFLGYDNNTQQNSPPTSPNNGYINLEGN